MLSQWNSSNNRASVGDTVLISAVQAVACGKLVGGSLPGSITCISVPLPADSG
jgi:hypothetical protein